MILIYIDPSCSGLQTVPCKSKKDIKKTLASVGMDEESCGGEVIHYVFIDKDGSKQDGSLDFT